MHIYLEWERCYLMHHPQLDYISVLLANCSQAKIIKYPDKNM